MLTDNSLCNKNLSSFVCILSSVFCHLSIALYICRERSTNQLFLCKTNPIYRMPKLMQTQYIQGFMKISCSIKAQKQTQNKPNSNPIAERVKLMQSVYLQRIMKKIAAKGYEKQSQNKPNSNPIKACPERSRMGQFSKYQNERKIGCIHISKKYNVLIRKVLGSQTYFVVKNELY